MYVYAYTVLFCVCLIYINNVLQNITKIPLYFSPLFPLVNVNILYNHSAMIDLPVGPGHILAQLLPRPVLPPSPPFSPGFFLNTSSRAPKSLPQALLPRNLN